MFEHLYDDPADRPHGPGNPDYEYERTREQDEREREERESTTQGETQCL